MALIEEVQLRFGKEWKIIWRTRKSQQGKVSVNLTRSSLRLLAIPCASWTLYACSGGDGHLQYHVSTHSSKTGCPGVPPQIRGQHLGTSIDEFLIGKVRTCYVHVISRGTRANDIPYDYTRIFVPFEVSNAQENSPTI